MARTRTEARDLVHQTCVKNIYFINHPFNFWMFVDIFDIICLKLYTCTHAYIYIN